jgi:hypothetical protein
MILLRRILPIHSRSISANRGRCASIPPIFDRPAPRCSRRRSRLGAERIGAPAGTFDTIKIRRLVYAGDWEGPLRETQILQLDWYAPALGRSVRAESSSQWLDVSRCSRSGCALFRGDWDVLELVSHSAARVSSFPAARDERIASTAD